jgi:formate-dependent nitrite reductase membrane component NrfD
MVFAEANVWHWWISVPLVLGAIALVLATVIGYFVKMNQLKYPKK